MSFSKKKWGPLTVNKNLLLATIQKAFRELAGNPFTPHKDFRKYRSVTDYCDNMLVEVFQKDYVIGIHVYCNITQVVLMKKLMLTFRNHRWAFQEGPRLRSKIFNELFLLVDLGVF